jgi:predicted HTH transcriptional regulator
LTNYQKYGIINYQRKKDEVTTMTNAKMTEREFLTKVMATEGVAEDVKAYAEAGIAKLDEKNAKRKNTETKAQRENKVLMGQVLETIEANGSMVASEVASVLEVSTQKASALCVLLVKEGKLKVTDKKVKNKGAVKCYSLAD